MRNLTAGRRIAYWEMERSAEMPEYASDLCTRCGARRCSARPVRTAQGMSCVDFCQDEERADRREDEDRRHAAQNGSL